MTDSKINEACKFRFDSIEKDIRDIEGRHDKSFDWLQDIKEAVLTLTIIQENQQTTLANQQETLKDQTVAQNKILSELLEFEKKREKALMKQAEGSRELSAKKIIAISTIVSATITAVATIIVALIVGGA